MFIYLFVCLFVTSADLSDSDEEEAEEEASASAHHFTPTRDLHTALTEYYSYYNPEKLSNVPKIVSTFGRSTAGLRRMFNRLR